MIAGCRSSSSAIPPKASFPNRWQGLVKAGRAITLPAPRFRSAVGWPVPIHRPGPLGEIPNAAGLRSIERIEHLFPKIA